MIERKKERKKYDKLILPRHIPKATFVLTAEVALGSDAEVMKISVRSHTNRQTMLRFVKALETLGKLYTIIYKQC